MKKFYVYAAGITLSLFSFAHKTWAQQQPVPFSIINSGTINFSELAQQELKNPPAVVFRNRENEPENVVTSSSIAPIPADAVETTIALPNQAAPVAPSPAPVITFNGLLDNNTLIPPDVMGVAGSNHVMETINTQYRISTKTGGIVSTLSLSSFWSGAPNTSFFSDPRLLYDPINNKWLTCIIGQLTSNNHYAFYIAVSQTDDPTGTWFEYVLDTGSGSDLPDYPSMGFNTNWVVITDDNFSGGFSWNKEDIWVMNRASLYSGTLGTASRFTDNTHIQVIFPAATLDASQTTEYLISDATNSNSGGFGYVKVANITGSVGSPVYNTGVTIGTNHPWSNSAIDVKQKGSTKLIESDDQRFISCIYRNGSLWGSHHVYLPATNPTHSAADMWQIDPARNTVQQFIRVEDATGNTNYYYPSMAVNSNNDVLMGYTLSGTNDYASGGYSFRAGTDAANTIQSNFTFKAGLASYFKDFGSGRNRWGDYSMTSVDPVDGSFWTLVEWAQTGNNWGTVWANVAGGGGTSCTDNFEPNNSKGAAAPISVNTDITALISSSTDKDFYSFANSVSQPNIQVTLSSLPANYNLFLFNPSGTQVASSKNSGTANEKIIFNTSVAGTYKIKVVGVSGAFNSSSCYTLNASISSTPFRLTDIASGNTLDSKMISIYPNPTTGNMTIDFSALKSGQAQLIMYDMLGKQVYMQNANVFEGINHFTIQPDQLTYGLYMIEVKCNGTSEHSRVMIQK
ncbi:MAG: T9SS type A sorting domain-containing protein [Chitinophagales bacterium]|nr:T9SS type A sorting domain-containing protein [Chitinophagales bacterium]